MNITNKDAAVLVNDLVVAIHNGKVYLSELDGAIGDGDHGINMNKGFTMAGERLQRDAGDLAHDLGILGDTLLTDIGGSMGPLYGMFFAAMSDTCQGATEIGSSLFGDMLTAGMEMVISIGSAKQGDKTLLDTLIPANDAFHKAVSEGQSFIQALQAMKQAADSGRDATRDMVATVGRASRLGERSRGAIDPGAASCCLILNSMADSLIRLAESQPTNP